MDKYKVGASGITLKDTGGTWKAVDSHKLGFILWESEKYGSAAGKILTDDEGNIIYKGISSLTDFKVQVYISQKEKQHNEASKPGKKKNAEPQPIPEIVNVENRKRKKAASKNASCRESVLRKLREYQTLVELQKKQKAMIN